MAAVEIIAGKRKGRALGRKAWLEFADSAASGAWSDSQLAAMLMAIALVGLDDRETGWLVEAMAQTGIPIISNMGIKINQIGLLRRWR